MRICRILFFFFFNDTATTEIYTLSLHDALPISSRLIPSVHVVASGCWARVRRISSEVENAFVPVKPKKSCICDAPGCRGKRSEEHTSELQSRSDLVCRLLLEKKKTIK